MAELSDLRNLHPGETIWVLGSGPSLNFISGAFFDGKVTVSTNFSSRAIGHKPDYTFTHYHDNARDLSTDSGIVVTIEKDTYTIQPWQGERPQNLVLAETPHDNPVGSTWNPFSSHKPGANQIVYGSSSLHGAMHLAAHLGASFIVLVGADCGNIDGKSRVSTYQYPAGHTLWSLYNDHHKLMKDYLQQNYPVRVHSLNPFINLNLEGHRFEGV